MSALRWLEPSDPADSFPDPSTALTDPDGLLAVGGDLSIPRLLSAYQRGIFPWYQDNQPILWWSPARRAVLFPQDLHISRSLTKTLRQNRFDVSVDRDFAGVVGQCASTRTESGTWITPDMASAYGELHKAGHAHSVETWLGNELAGGLYGVNIGAVFFGESMFSRYSDASKIALVALVHHCQERGIRLIDCQLPSAHLSSLGIRQIPRRHFLELLARHTVFTAPSDWSRLPEPSAQLLAE